MGRSVSHLKLSGACVPFGQPGYLGLQWKDWGWHPAHLDSALFVLLTKAWLCYPIPIPGIFFYAQSDLWMPFGRGQVGMLCYLQSMVRHSLLSLHEAPMGLRDTPLQKGVMRRCRGLRAGDRDRDTPWLCNTAGWPSAHVAVQHFLLVLLSSAVFIRREALEIFLLFRSQHPLGKALLAAQPQRNSSQN